MSHSPGKSEGNVAGRKEAPLTVSPWEAVDSASKNVFGA